VHSVLTKVIFECILDLPDVVSDHYLFEPILISIMHINVTLNYFIKVPKVALCSPPSGRFPLLSDF
jgi:hypothetical protein